MHGFSLSHLPSISLVGQGRRCRWNYPPSATKLRLPSPIPRSPFLHLSTVTHHHMRPPTYSTDTFTASVSESPPCTSTTPGVVKPGPVPAIFIHDFSINDIAKPGRPGGMNPTPLPSVIGFDVCIACRKNPIQSASRTGPAGRENGPWVSPAGRVKRGNGRTLKVRVNVTHVNRKA